MIIKIRKPFSRRSLLKAVSTFGLTALTPSLFAEKDSDERLARLLAGKGGWSEFRCAPLSVGAGPFYPAVDQFPWASDLTRIPGKAGKAKGQILYIMGKTTDFDCRTVSGARVELWQADINGHYKHPVDQRVSTQPLDPNFRYFGQVVTQLDGHYLFKTIVPSSYKIFDFPRCSHIHFRIKHPEHGEVTTQVMFEGKEDDVLRKKDLVFQGMPDYLKSKLVVPKEDPKELPELAERLTMEPDALVCRFDQAFI